MAGERREGGGGRVVQRKVVQKRMRIDPFLTFVVGLSGWTGLVARAPRIPLLQDYALDMYGGP